MSDLKTNDGKQAIYCLEHLLYEVPFSTLHNVSALLAQESGRPVSEFGQSAGHWTFKVVERFLWDRGMKCIPTTRNGHWRFDLSPNFLRRGPGFIGFIKPQTLETVKWTNGGWQTESQKSLEDISSWLDPDTVTVHRMWAAVQPFYKENKAFHITTDDWPWSRHEHRPNSCWQGERASYEGRSRAVKSFMRAHKDNPIMMSTSKEMVLCKPSPSGWQTETLLNYEFLTMHKASEKILETLVSKLHNTLDQDKACVVLSHAIYSVLTYMGGRLTPGECSSFTRDELEQLRRYEMGLEQCIDTSD